MFHFNCLLCLFMALIISTVTSLDISVITNFTVNFVRTPQAVIFSCDKKVLRDITDDLLLWDHFVHAINLKYNYSLLSILTRWNYAHTSVIVDCSCNESFNLLVHGSTERYFNKTYQWLLLDLKDIGIENLLPIELGYLGPNAQITYVNISRRSYQFWDVHSKGRHLQNPLNVQLIGEKNVFENNFIVYRDISELQGIHYRHQFNRLTLRGVTVIDKDNITTNHQIESILSEPVKDAGVSAFTKYHYELLKILCDRFNFTINFRNTRGWASRLGNSSFRLGFLGVLMRDEADVGASGVFNRINRFAEFDTIHQGWKFETAFLYRFTPDLDKHVKSGNFLAPFDGQVWLFAICTFLAVNFIWVFVELLNSRM